MKDIRYLVKDCAISFGIALLIIGFLETSFRIAKFTGLKIYSANRRVYTFRDRFIAFDKKVPIKDLKKRSLEVGDRLMYKPWIQIGNYDHKGKFSIVINGSRLVKDADLLKDCISKKEIWMFGGSTMYGVGVPYSENIPSFLQKILNKNNACLKVVNYGVPYHYSKQETINFVNNLLDHEKPPAFAIFLDGLNDFMLPGSTLRGEPHFTPILTSLVPKGKGDIRQSRGWAFKNLFNLEIISFLKKRINSSEENYSNKDLPKGYTEASAAKEISELFIKNTIGLGKICDAYDVKCFRFLQPVAAIDYSPPSNDSYTNWAQEENLSSRFKIGYKLIRSFTNKNIRGISLIDLSKLFKNYYGIPYVDSWHYAPRANNLIAEFIYSSISSEINNN